MSGYQKCPKCDKKGLHYNNDLIGKVYRGADYICRYCGFSESDEDMIERKKNE